MTLWPVYCLSRKVMRQHPRISHGHRGTGEMLKFVLYFQEGLKQLKWSWACALWWSTISQKICLSVDTRWTADHRGPGSSLLPLVGRDMEITPDVIDKWEGLIDSDHLELTPLYHPRESEVPLQRKTVFFALVAFFARLSTMTSSLSFIRTTWTLKKVIILSGLFLRTLVENHFPKSSRCKSSKRLISKSNTVLTCDFFLKMLGWYSG